MFTVRYLRSTDKDVEIIEILKGNHLHNFLHLHKYFVCFSGMVRLVLFILFNIYSMTCHISRTYLNCI